jgi:hypothetical protein
MDEQDTQDLQSQSNLKFGSITEAIALQERGLTVQCQHRIQVRFRNQIVGDSWTLSCSSCPSMFIRKRGDLRFVPIAGHRDFHLILRRRMGDGKSSLSAWFWCASEFMLWRSHFWASERSIFMERTRVLHPIEAAIFGPS